MVLLKWKIDSVHFGPFGDSAGVGSRLVQVCAKHTIGSEIIFDATDSTPK
jgi:hypothetical protein